MPIKDLIEGKVVSIRPEAKIQDAAKLLFDKHVGALVVTAKNNGSQEIPIGIITDRDITIALGQNSKKVSETLVKEVMNSNVIVAGEDDGIFETIKKMSINGVRRIPVVSKSDQIMGMLTSDDLLIMLGDEIQQISKILQNEINFESKVQESGRDFLRKV